MKPFLKYLALCLFFELPLSAGAQTAFKPQRLGLSSSLKGYGLVLNTDSNRKEKTLNSFCLYLDCYKLFSNQEDTPGYKFLYSHNALLKQGYLNDAIVYSVYAGSGGVLGFVRDYSQLAHLNRGVEIGLCVSGGTLLSFRDSNWELGLSFFAEFALHLRQDEEVAHKINLSWYANGLFRTLLPQINVFYRF